MQMKRILSIAMSVIMAVSFVLTSAVPAAAVITNKDNVSAARIWDGTTDTSWYTGDKDSYDIYTAEQFAGISALCGKSSNSVNFNGVTLNLKNDIILNDTSNYENWGTQPPENRWTPIGDVGSMLGSHPFRGCLNGNGHTISGLYVRDDGWSPVYGQTGIFRYTFGACLINLRIEKGYAHGPAASGALVGSAEATYIENIEVEDFTIDSLTSGGIVGETNDIDLGQYAGVLGQIPFMAFGYFINPLLLNSSAFDNSAHDSYLLNCKAKNCNIKGEQAGGIIGKVKECTGMYFCLSENNFVNSTIWRNNNWGAVYGLNEAPDYLFTKCYEYNIQKPSNYSTARVDAETVKAVKKSTLTSSSFAKKLGDGFEYVKGSSPAVKAIIKTDVKIALYDNKAKISWDKVSGATKYKVYMIKNGKYSVVSTTKSTSATLKNIKKGKSYQFLIRAYFANGTYKTVDGGKFTLKEPNRYPNTPNENGNVNFKSGQQYVIKSKLTGLYLDIKGASKDDGALLIQCDYSGSANQKWYFEKLDNGFYLIKNCNSGKYLDVEKCSNKDGGIILQWYCHGSKNQQWKITKVDGYYKIINRNSSMCIDLLKGNPDSGASVAQWTYSGSDNQLWSIEPV